MRNNYKFYTALLLGLMGLQGVSAQSTEANVERTKQILTFGNWNDLGKEFGVDTANLPTAVKNYFYNNKGKLVKTLEGAYQLGDNPNTILEFEKLGDVAPETYTSYLYDQNDRLSAVVACNRWSKNGWFHMWGVNDTIAVYTYDENNKVVSKKEKDTQYQYTWNGEQLVMEEETSNEGCITTYYSNFVAENTNCPQTAIVVFEETGAQGLYIETEYDADQHIVKQTEYSLANLVRDENGNVSGEKGEPDVQTVSVYNNGQMTSEVVSLWNKEAGKFVEETKKEIKENAERGGMETSYFEFVNGAWKALYSEVEVKGAYEDIVPAELTVQESGPRANSVLISFDNPTDTPKTVTGWNVYRNGTLLGEASFIDNTWKYEDNEVANGNYDYYAMPIEGDKNFGISNVVAHHFGAEVVQPDSVKVIESGKVVKEGKESYMVRLAWDAPKSKSTLLGYNIYVDPVKGANNKADNSTLIKQLFYELELNDTLEHNVVLEAVYAQDYIQSNAAKVKVDAGNVVSNGITKKVKKVTIYGDTMGSHDITSKSSEDVYYYDKNNNLMMKVSLGFAFGDDPDTDEVEVAGQAAPTQYTVYAYNEKGQMISEKTREYGVFSGCDRSWQKEMTTLTEKKYDEETGRLIEKKEPSRIARYTWVGENVTVEDQFTFRGNKEQPLAHIVYSDFATVGNNLPQYGLGVSLHPYSSSGNRIYEMEYDAQGRMIAKRVYKHGPNVEKDEQGMIIKADKGDIADEYIWNYEGDQLMSMYHNKWSTGLKKLAPYSKTIYTHTANGVREENYSYANSAWDTTKGWTKSSIATEKTENNYDPLTAPGTLVATDMTDMVNSVELSFEPAAKAYGSEVVYEVLRNGVKIGEAHPGADGKMVYQDIEVPNGLWHYLVKAKTPFESVDCYSTNLVEKEFNTVLPEAANVRFPINGQLDNGDYQLVVEWDAPETNLKIVGYNVFTDIRSFTKNPSPVNGVHALSADTHEYTFKWAPTTNTNKTVAIEVVYNIGKIKTDNIPVSLNDVPVGIATMQQAEHLKVVGNEILVSGNCNDLSVYAANGARVAHYNGVNSVNLNALPNGMYVIKLLSDKGVETLKVIKK